MEQRPTYEELEQRIKKIKEENAELKRTLKEMSLSNSNELEQRVEERTAELEKEIAERKQAENEKEKLEIRLRHSQKMEALGTLAGGIAHEFNNILAVIIGYTELVRQELLVSEGSARELESVLRAADRGKNLVHQIFTFSRKREVVLEPLLLSGIVNRTVDILKRTLPRMIRIELHLSEDLEMIEGDSNQLEQMLMNLSTNARDAMPEGGTLIIETSNVALDEEYCKQHPETLPGRYVLLRISDMGHGIDKDTLRQIFDPFFTTKNVGKGTGLGLSTVFGIVEGHGGHITCHSDPGKGTAFNIYLPAFTHERSESIPERRFLEDIQSGNETILIVDDEPGIRDIGSQALSKQGYTVLTADSGEEALNIFNRHREKGKDIDLVVLDIGMPGMGGQKCLKELFKIDPGAKVIIASGYSDNDYLNEALSSGALGFATKPFKKTEFLKIVREVLAHHTAGKFATLRRRNPLI